MITDIRFDFSFNLWLGIIVKNLCENITIHNGVLVLTVKENCFLVVLFFLRDHTNCQYKVLSDMAGVDYPINRQRFEVAYQLVSLKFGHRITLKLKTEENKIIKSVNNIYPSANWNEREIFDMFGIIFLNHPDLRRLLTDYGFEGYPLRKDFPLSGYTEVRFDSKNKRVICEPLIFSQESRLNTFSFKKQWNLFKNCNIY